MINDMMQINHLKKLWEGVIEMARLDKRREVVVFEEQEDDEAIELRFYDVVKKGTGEFDFTGWQCNNKVEYWIRSQFC
jgi:hypothetical protein